MSAPPYLAPFGTCDACGKSGHDWAFRYQGLCSRCYRRWRREKAVALKRLRPPNENVPVGEGVVVTRNVKKRLESNAQTEVPFSRSHRFWDGLSWLVLLLGPMVPILYYLLGLRLPVDGWILLVGWCILILALIGITEHFSGRENRKRWAKLLAHVTKLAVERQQRIAEMEEFYASAEWKVLRKAVIRKQGRTCKMCGKRRLTDADLAVDHVLPRSKYPELALERENLQVLCKSCNSSKGARISQ